MYIALLIFLGGIGGARVDGAWMSEGGGGGR